MEKKEEWPFIRVSPSHLCRTQQLSSHRHDSLLSCEFFVLLERDWFSADFSVKVDRKRMRVRERMSHLSNSWLTVGEDDHIVSSTRLTDRAKSSISNEWKWLQMFCRFYSSVHSLSRRRRNPLDYSSESHTDQSTRFVFTAQRISCSEGIKQLLPPNFFWLDESIFDLVSLSTKDSWPICSTLRMIILAMVFTRMRLCPTGVLNRVSITMRSRCHSHRFHRIDSADLPMSRWSPSLPLLMLFSPLMIVFFLTRQTRPVRYGVLDRVI